MARNRGWMIALAAGAAATGASAQSAGDVIFADQLTDTIYLIQSPGVWKPLVVFHDPDVCLAQITNIGAAWYIANVPLPVHDPSTAGIFRIDVLFGSPAVTTLAQGEPLQGPIGLRYDPHAGRLLVVNHVGGQIDQPKHEGVYAVDPQTGVVTEVYKQQDGPPPVYRDGNRLAADPHSDGFFITCVNGGLYDGGNGDLNKGSCIWRLDAAQGVVSLLVDLSSVEGGPLTFARGIAAPPRPAIFILAMIELRPSTGSRWTIRASTPASPGSPPASAAPRNSSTMPSHRNSSTARRTPRPSAR